jgi:hypothetical protein
MTREVTALKAQKKNPNRINVYLDGEFAFGLARIVAAWLTIGQHLSEVDIDRLKRAGYLGSRFSKSAALSELPAAFRGGSPAETKRTGL